MRVGIPGSLTLASVRESMAILLPTETAAQARAAAKVRHSEGTVRREGNHARVSTELVDASNDNAIWADSYDRDLRRALGDAVQTWFGESSALSLLRPTPSGFGAPGMSIIEISVD